MKPRTSSAQQQLSLSRRSFVKASIAAAAASTTFGAPLILHAEDKAAEPQLVVGQGRHKYEVVDNWAKRPEDKLWGDCHMVQEVADGRIFIHHTGPEAIHVYDPDGKFIEAFGKEFANAAHGMDLRKEGNEEFLYFAPTGQHRVVKTNLKGEHVFEIGYPKDAKNAEGKPCYEDREIISKNKDGSEKRTTRRAEEFYVPTFIAFGDNGEFYVTDGYGSNYVHRYNAKGEYMSTFGGGGNGEGQLACPHGIYFDRRDPQKPMVLVADRSNVRLQWFTPDGKFVKMVKDELRAPCHFDEQEGDLLIPDLHGRVTIFDKDNKLVTHLGDNLDAKQRGNHGVPKDKLVAGNFVTPHGAIWDRKGDIYVTEWLPYGRVTKLRHVG